MNSPASILPVVAGGILLLLPAQGHAQNAEALQIERSTYQAPAERTPFWPIGWNPQNPELAPVVLKSETDTTFFIPERFVLTSISIDRTTLALINGRAYGEGDLVPINERFSAEVISIHDGEVKLRFRDKTISVVLKVRPTRTQPQGAPKSAR